MMIAMLRDIVFDNVYTKMIYSIQQKQMLWLFCEQHSSHINASKLAIYKNCWSMKIEVSEQTAA